jgi:hypothetical protein
VTEARSLALAIYIANRVPNNTSEAKEAQGPDDAQVDEYVCYTGCQTE